MTWENPTATRIQQILQATRTVAVVGASPNPARGSHAAATPPCRGLARRAEAAGLDVDRCLKIEHARFQVGRTW